MATQAILQDLLREGVGRGQILARRRDVVEAVLFLDPIQLDQLAEPPQYRCTRYVEEETDLRRSHVAALGVAKDNGGVDENTANARPKIGRVSIDRFVPDTTNV